jgi:hypothetical protein
MDRSEYRAVEPIAVMRDVRASNPVAEKSPLESNSPRRALEHVSGVLRELAELTCHWD